MNCKITLFFIIQVLLQQFVYSQVNKPLKDLLWEKANPCYSQFEDMDEDGMVDYSSLIDDSKNGYLQMSGEWPTCGCGCSVTVGAYKDAGGKYSIISTEKWNCSWKKELSSNVNISSLMPEEFGPVTFIPTYRKQYEGETPAIFYVNMEIPRVGTDTKVSLELIPFGIEAMAEDIICYDYSEEGYEKRSLYKLGIMANDIEDEKTLDYLLNAEYTKISAHDKSVVEEAIGEDYGSFKSMNELVMYLKIIKKTYNLFSDMKYKTIILGWDREKGRFFVKEKIENKETISFRKFLKDNAYWSPTC